MSEVRHDEDRDDAGFFASHQQATPPAARQIYQYQQSTPSTIYYTIPSIDFFHPNDLFV